MYSEVLLIRDQILKETTHTSLGSHWECYIELYFTNERSHRHIKVQRLWICDMKGIFKKLHTVKE